MSLTLLILSGLMPSGMSPLLELLLTQIYLVIQCYSAKMSSLSPGNMKQGYRGLTHFNYWLQVCLKVLDVNCEYYWYSQALLYYVVIWQPFCLNPHKWFVLQNDIFVDFQLKYYLTTFSKTGHFGNWRVFYPSPVLAFGCCRCLGLCVCVFVCPCVRVCVYQSWACPHDNSPLV